MPTTRWAPYVAGTILVTYSLGGALSSTPLLRIIELTVCRSLYNQEQAYALTEEKTCKTANIQSQVAFLLGWDGFFSGIPEIFLAFPYAYICSSGRVDRRWILIANIISTVLAIGYTTFVCYFHTIFDVRVMWLSSLFSIFGGGGMVFSSLLHAVIAESVEPGALYGIFLPSRQFVGHIAKQFKNRSKALYLVNASRIAALVAGQNAAAEVMDRNLWLPVILGLLITSSTIPLVALLPKKVNLGPDSPTSAKKEPVKHGMNRVRELLGGSFSIITNLCRETPTRYALLSVFVHTLGITGSESHLKQWASVVFQLRLSRVAYIFSYHHLLAGFFLISLSVATKLLQSRWPSHRINLVVIYFSLSVAVIGVIGTAISGIVGSLALLISSAVVVFALQVGFLDALKALVTEDIKKTEENTEQKGDITSFYIGFTVLERACAMLAGPVWAAVFGAGLSIGGAYVTLPFWVAAICFASTVVPVLKIVGETKQGYMVVDEHERENVIELHECHHSM